MLSLVGAAFLAVLGEELADDDAVVGVQLNFRPPVGVAEAEEEWRPHPPEDPPPPPEFRGDLASFRSVDPPYFLCVGGVRLLSFSPLVPPVFSAATLSITNLESDVATLIELRCGDGDGLRESVVRLTRRGTTISGWENFSAAGFFTGMRVCEAGLPEGERWPLELIWMRVGPRCGRGVLGAELEWAFKFA